MVIVPLGEIEQLFAPVPQDLQTALIPPSDEVPDPQGLQLTPDTKVLAGL